jgi:hemerythrin-like domain-containing protein
MPIVIGGKPESHFTDPIGLLTDCHRRIERFLSVLARLGKDAHSGALGQEQRAALETALRYFREAAPKHTADEEESLFPRLRAAAGSPGLQAALGRVEALENDHERADLLHAEVDRLGSAWLREGSLPDADASRLSSLLAELAELYRAHIAVEESEVFPLAGAALAPVDRDEIGREMAARRGVKS